MRGDEERNPSYDSKKIVNQIIIHIGAPRTGTTVIQKSLLKEAKKHIVLTKKPFSSSSGGATRQAQITGTRKLLDIKNLSEVNKHDIKLFNMIYTCCRETASTTPNPNCQLALNHIATVLSGSSSPIIMSSERLADTYASLNCFSNHVADSNSCFPLLPLCKSITDAHAQPLISACLREPFRYLRSKYLRTVIQRRSIKQRDLSPKEYVKKQATLESNHPGTSALTPAMHAEFIKQLQKHAFVKAFGFQELLASDDVFSLMGLQGEDQYAFRDFPRENKLPFSKEQEQVIEIEITQALKQYGFYDRIMKAQMFE